MANLSLFVGIIVGLIAISGGIIKFFEYLRSGPSIKELILRSSVIFVIVLLIVGGSILFSSTTTISVHPPTNPLNNASANSGTPSPTPTQMIPSPTDTPSPPLVKTPVTLPENITLKCDCTDPVVVTITKIVIEPPQNRMIWTLTFYNNSQSFVESYFEQFTLQKGDQVHYPTTGEQTYDASGEGIVTNVSLQAGETKQVTLTFSFVPYKSIPYTLVSQLAAHSNVTFNPAVIQF